MSSVGSFFASASSAGVEGFEASLSSAGLSASPSLSSSAASSSLALVGGPEIDDCLSSRRAAAVSESSLISGCPEASLGLPPWGVLSAMVDIDKRCDGVREGEGTRNDDGAGRVSTGPRGTGRRKAASRVRACLSFLGGGDGQMLVARVAEYAQRRCVARQYWFNVGATRPAESVV